MGARKPRGGSFASCNNRREDARKKRIIPTEEALSVSAQVLADVEAVGNDLVYGISEEELEIFQKVIQKMIRNLEA